MVFTFRVPFFSYFSLSVFALNVYILQTVSCDHLCTFNSRFQFPSLFAIFANLFILKSYLQCIYHYSSFTVYL